MPVQALIARSPWHLYVLYAAMFACYAPEWIGSFFQRPERGATRRDRGSHFLLVFALIAGIVGAFFFVQADFAGTTLTWHQPLLFWIGIASMLVGLAFRWYSIRVLGRFFTRDVATRPGQTVVEAGPYRLIRHPSYSGSLMMFLGTGLAMTNWASGLAIMLGVAIGYGWRVRVEEQALCTDLGQSYREYMLRTRRFIPHVW